MPLGGFKVNKSSPDFDDIWRGRGGINKRGNGVKAAVGQCAQAEHNGALFGIDASLNAEGMRNVSHMVRGLRDCLETVDAGREVGEIGSRRMLQIVFDFFAARENELLTDCVKRNAFIKSVFGAIQNLPARVMRSLAQPQIMSQFDFMQFERTLSGIAALSGEKQVQGALSRFFKGKIDSPALMKVLKDIQVELNAQRFPERPIAQIEANFSKAEFGLSEKRLKFAVDAFKQVDRHRKELSDLSDLELKKRIVNLKLQIEGKSEYAKITERLALLREATKRFFSIMPYSTQMMTVIACIGHNTKLKGRLAQVKTGEGKSTITMLMAAYYAMQGRHVDVISSASSLAVRDAEKYKPFLDFLGVTSSHVCKLQPGPADFKHQVLYGTNTDFEFAILRDAISKEKTRRLEDGTIRPRDVVLIDEVDNLMIDKGQSPAIISLPKQDPYASLVGPLFQFASLEGGKIQFKGKQQSLELLHDYFEAHYPLLLKGVAKLSEDVLWRWVQSAVAALYQRKENIDYVVKPYEDPLLKQARGDQPRIIIIDKITGQLAESSRWGNRLHQFLELKHGLAVEPETGTAAALSHPAFFGGYQKILGLTGTMGDAVEREEIESVYKIDTFNVPPHNPSQMRCYEPILANTHDEHASIIAQQVHSERRSGRPVLVLLETIKDANAIHKALTKSGVPCQLYDAVQAADENYLIGKAGLPGAVTVATNTAGRGTDIKLGRSALAAGGLHVILGFYPSSLRVELQAIGRAARQGQPGTSQIVASIAGLSPELRPYLHDRAQPFEQLELGRAALSQRDSDFRMVQSERSSRYFEFLEQFSHHLERWRHIDKAHLSSTLAKKLVRLAKAAVLKEGEALETLPDSALGNAYRHFLNANDKPLSDWTAAEFLPWVRSMVDAVEDQLLDKWMHTYERISEVVEADNGDEDVKMQAASAHMDRLISKVKGTYLDDPVNGVLKEIGKIIGVNKTKAKKLNKKYAPEASPIQPRGLPNNGNTCWINAPLVALALNKNMSRAVVERLQQLKNASDDKSLKDKNALQQLKILLNYIAGERNDNNISDAINIFRTAMRTALQHGLKDPENSYTGLTDGAQHDASESFIDPLLKKLLPNFTSNGPLALYARDVKSTGSTLEGMLLDYLSDEKKRLQEASPEDIVVTFQRAIDQEQNGQYVSYRSDAQLKLPENGRLTFNGETYRIEAIGLHEVAEGRECGRLDDMWGHYTCWVPESAGSSGSLLKGTLFSDDALSKSITKNELEKNVTFLTLKKVT